MSGAVPLLALLASIEYGRSDNFTVHLQTKMPRYCQTLVKNTNQNVITAQQRR